MEENRVLRRSARILEKIEQQHLEEAKLTKQESNSEAESEEEKGELQKKRCLIQNKEL